MNKHSGCIAYAKHVPVNTTPPPCRFMCQAIDNGMSIILIVNREHQGSDLIIVRNPWLVSLLPKRREKDGPWVANNGIHFSDGRNLKSHYRTLHVLH